MRYTNIMRIYPALAAAAVSMILLWACSGSGAPEQKPVEFSETGDLHIANLAVLNSPEDDFAPFASPLDGKEIFFTSNRRYDGSRQKIDNKSQFGETVYHAESGSQTVQEAKPFIPALLNVRNQGSMAISGDGNELFFSSSYLDSSTGGSDLYVIQKTVGQWSTPVSLSVLNSRWWEAHPALSPDGKTLVFASNRDNADPGINTTGYRSTDLWLAIRDIDGNWSLPSRLPSPVNTPYSEISPFFSAGGDLYFATDRFENRGFDIVRCRQTAEGWSEPQRMPQPINSASDDVFPFIPKDRGGIMFASNRPGGQGGLDLYKADFPSRIVLKGAIARQEQTGAFAPAQGVPLIIEDQTRHKSWTVHTNPDGTYETQLDANAEYSIRTGASECYQPVAPQYVRVGQPWDFDTVIVRDFAISRLVFPQFRLDRYNIPFFVTGYYHPNTNSNLDRLDERFAKGELSASEGGSTPFIDRNDEQYRSFAIRIEAIFDTIYSSIIDNYLPLFNSCALNDEVLLIEVRGYVDPRGLTPGFYPDETVETFNMTIKKGDRMAGQDGNFKLANLRAYHTMQMLDRQLAERSGRYRELKQAGRIKLQAQGVGIDTISGGNVHDPAKRRIDIELTIVKQNERH